MYIDSPKLSVADKAARYQWCKNNQKHNFTDYLFSDKITVRVLEVPLHHLRKKIVVQLQFLIHLNLD